MPAKTIVILQSNYIPWKGYFDLMAVADEFVIYDEAQYTRRDWRNRNKIIINGAPHWLTVPVQTKGNFDAPIDEIRVENGAWAMNHWRTIELNYRRAQHFPEFEATFHDAYTKASELELLTEINEMFLRLIANILGITTPISRSREIPKSTQDPTERLVEICKALGGGEYVSGPAARSYIKQDVFEAAGVSLSYANYSGYPTYDQKSTSFEHGVSMLDVLFRCGRDARGHLKSIDRREDFLDPS